MIQNKGKNGGGKAEDQIAKISRKKSKASTKRLLLFFLFFLPLVGAK